MKVLKVGTDFSGIGSPEEALTELKNEGFLDFESEFACEIDKYARLSHQELHDSKVMYEDITKRNHSEVPQLDLYVAGFPCQAFSIAGKQLGFEDVRGTLFFNVADFIRENQPKTFVLENVKGLLSHEKGKTFRTIIDLLSNGGGTVNGQMSLDFFDDGLGYHIHYRVLNTKEHGIPQNRERIFIVGFKESKDYGFPVKEPLKLRLKDLLEEEVEDKYFLSDKAINSIILNEENLQKSSLNPEIAATIQCPGNSCGTYKGMNAISVKANTKKGFEEAKEGDSINYSVPTSKTRRVRVGKQVAQTLDTACNMGVVIGAMRGRNPKNPKSRKSGLETVQMLEINENGTSNCLTSVQKDNLVVTDRIRRLLPIECWRLQGFSDESFYKAEKVNSDTQLYKQAGNSITVDVIKKIIKNIYK